jgi:tetratricopeptide (TPR) repeat protein
LVPDRSCPRTAERREYYHASILRKLTPQQFESAKAAYRRVLDRDPKHAKVLQQLGWLHHQQSNSYSSQEQAIEYLEKSVGSGKTHAGSFSGGKLTYLQTTKMHRAGISWAAATWRSRSFPRHTKRISRLSIAMVAIQLSGARLVSCTIKSTSTVTPWTLTPGQSA